MKEFAKRMRNGYVVIKYPAPAIGISLPRYVTYLFSVADA
jgi:hypothetical protein